MGNLLNNVKIGTDFETFIFDTENNQAVSAIGICGGSKSQPLTIGQDCFRHEDNVAFEFGMPPCNTYEEFKFYISYCLTTGNQILSEINPNFELRTDSSIEFPLDQIAHPDAKLFGCEPALNAYTEDYDEKPGRDPEHPLRSFGFHIHLGWEGIENDLNTVFSLVKLMDFYLGIPSLVLDGDTERRKLYGNAGECRWKPYGFEYRTLGSGMLDQMDFVWNQTQRVIEVFNNKEQVADIVDFMDNNRAIIDNNDVVSAQEVCIEKKLVSQILTNV